MKHPASKILYGYWASVRGDRAAPASHAIDPVAIAGILADTFIADVQWRAGHVGLRLPIRMSGTRVDALAARALVGSDLLDLWSLESRAALEDLVFTVTDDTRAVVAGCAAAPSGHGLVGLELLLLPLRHEGKTHVRILGALSPAPPPHWLGLAAVGPMELRTERVIEPVDRAPTLYRDTVFQREALRRRSQFTVYDGGIGA